MGFAMFAPMFCIPPMEHILKEELLLSHTQTIMLYIAPSIMIVAIAIPAGIIADRIGVRKAAGIGAIMIALGAILRSTSANPSSLLGKFHRAVQVIPVHVRWRTCHWNNFLNTRHMARLTQSFVRRTFAVSFSFSCGLTYEALHSPLSC